jgi:hypothetical protein
MLICRSFDPASRIIQLVHIHSSCLTSPCRELVLRQIALEVMNVSIQTFGFGTQTFFDSVLFWTHINHPEAYPYATGVIGFCSPWITTVEEVELILSQKPYLYQGRIEFVDPSKLMTPDEVSDFSDKIVIFRD